jgi:hypothetical protein
MRKHVYGYVEPCRVAPKRQCLKVFGGTMDIEKFRMGKDPPMIQLPNEIYRACIVLRDDDAPVVVNELSRSTNRRMNAVNNSVGNTEQLKLKRSKPLQRAESSLEKSLGIKRISKQY